MTPFSTCLRHVRVVLFGTALLLAALGAAAQGISVSIGGALKDDNAEVWSRLVQLAGGPGARFAVFATASVEPERAAAGIVANLQRHGAVAEAVPVAPMLAGIDRQAAVRDPRWLDLVARSQGVFFSGGAQARLLDTLQPGGRATPLLQAVHELFRRGGVVAGTSSGAAVMSEIVFRDANDVLAVMKGRLRDGVEFDRGFGFLPAGVVIDQHFIKRGRIGRLLPLMVAKGLPLGIGVDENSAVIVRDSVVEAIGARGALVADLNGASHDATLGAFNLHGALLSWLDRGDRFDLRSRVLTPSAARLAGSRLDAGAPGFKGHFSGDMFHLDLLADDTLLTAMSQLVDSGESQALGLALSARPAADDPRPDLGFEWRLYKDADTVGWTGAGNEAGDRYTLHRLRLDINPVSVKRPLYEPWKR